MIGTEGHALPNWRYEHEQSDLKIGLEEQIGVEH